MSNRFIPISMLTATLLAMPGCSSDALDTSDEVRPPESSSATFATEPSRARIADRIQIGSTRVTRLSLRLGVAVQEASYLIEAKNEKRFLARVTREVQRARPKQMISVEDVDTSETATWAFDDDVATQTATDGRSVTVFGDEPAQQFVVTTSDGSELQLDYAGLAPESDEAQTNDALFALAVVGAAPLSEEQMEALDSSLTAAHGDFQVVDDGPVVTQFSRIRDFLCSGFMTAVCDTLVRVGVGGIASGAGTTAAGISLALGGGCMWAQSRYCKR